MNKFKISNRYTTFFSIELFTETLIYGEVKLPNVGPTPLTFATDASAREIAERIIEDIDSDRETATLMVDKTPMLIASEETIRRTLEIWENQSHLTSFEKTVLVDEARITDRQNLNIMNYLLNLPFRTKGE